MPLVFTDDGFLKEQQNDQATMLKIFTSNTIRNHAKRPLCTSVPPNFTDSIPCDWTEHLEFRSQGDFCGVAPYFREGRLLDPFLVPFRVDAAFASLDPARQFDPSSVATKGRGMSRHDTLDGILSRALIRESKSKFSSRFTFSTSHSASVDRIRSTTDVALLARHPRLQDHSPSCGIPVEPFLLFAIVCE